MNDESCPYCGGKGCKTCKSTGVLPRYKRSFESRLDEDVVIVIERNGTRHGRSRTGYPLYKWYENRVAMTLDELRKVAEKYL